MLILPTDVSRRGQNHLGCLVFGQGLGFLDEIALGIDMFLIVPEELFQSQDQPVPAGKEGSLFLRRSALAVMVRIAMMMVMLTVMIAVRIGMVVRHGHTS